MDYETTLVFYALRELLKLEKKEALNGHGDVLQQIDFNDLFLPNVNGG